MSAVAGDAEHAARRSSSRSSTSSTRSAASDRQVLRGVTLSVEARRGLRPRRRVGLRQVDRGARDRQLPPAKRARAIRRPSHRRPRTRSSLSAAQLRKLRSESVSMVYQNPGAALNPSIRVGKQVAEVFRDPRRERAIGDRSRASRARAGADRRPGLGDGALPPPALRRHAAARRDRDGARHRARRS